MVDSPLDSSIKNCKVGCNIDKHFILNKISFLVVPIQISCSEIDQCYSKFLEFVESSREPYKAELIQFLYPLFVRFYLDLVSSNYQEESKKFYSTYCFLFSQVEKYQNYLAALSNIQTNEDVRNDTYKNVGLNIPFQLSYECLEYLQRFLKIESNLLLLKVLLYYFEFSKINEEIHENAESRENLLEQFLVKEISQKDSSKKLAAPTCDTPEFASSKAIFDKLAEGAKWFPPTSIFRIICENTGICSVDLSLDNSLVSASFENSTIYLWPIKSNVKKPKHSSTNSLYDEKIDLDDSTYSDETIINTPNTIIYGLKFSACRKLLFSCGNNNLVAAWDIKEMKCAALYIGHTCTIWDVDVSPSTLYLASASKDTTTRIWKPDRNYPLQVFEGHLSDVNCVKFHPNCNYIATGSRDKTVKLWDLVSGKLVRSFISHNSSINCLAISPDGNYLASADDDLCIKIWDIGTSKVVKQFCGHTKSIYCLSFNENGSILASGGMELNVYLWDIYKSISSSTYLHKEESGANIYNSAELINIIPTTETSTHLLRFTQPNSLMAIDSLIQEENN